MRAALLCALVTASRQQNMVEELAAIESGRLPQLLVEQPTTAAGEAASAAAAATTAACTCSPFSGNPSGCCTGDDRSCHNWFSHETCGTQGRGPFCCNSNFASKCCKTSACTAGCRNSLQGDCECKNASTFAAIGYNESLATRLLGFNAASQCDADALRTWTCKACPLAASLTDINVTESDGHLAYVGYDAARDTITAVFRGSLSVEDWVDNLDVVKTPAYGDLGCSDCHVHKGFLAAFESLRVGVEGSIAALLERHPGRRVALTGHSLGAAMAVHAAVHLRLVQQLPNVDAVYTFGQPRVGDAAFAAWHSANFPAWYRVVHWNDPVPHLPPHNLGFAHTAREIWYDKSSDDAIVCDGSGEDPDCSLSVEVALVFTDHCTYLGHNNCQCEAF